RPVAARTKAKNLKAIPLSYFEAHAELKATSKTSLDFSSYIIEAIREKLERDGAIGQ
ncbi:molecular chaperone GroEL, partial [Salmonella enterica subsp. enterica serovar Minnesota]|nr:molecular chaperone GroEL [Escherichia coli]MEA1696439.1 molecular chaperone GroEL [Salmonella enterica subsp. enterica serovar Minnesota]